MAMLVTAYMFFFFWIGYCSYELYRFNYYLGFILNEVVLLKFSFVTMSIIVFSYSDLVFVVFLFVFMLDELLLIILSTSIKPDVFFCIIAYLLIHVIIPYILFSLFLTAIRYSLDFIYIKRLSSDGGSFGVI